MRIGAGAPVRRPSFRPGALAALVLVALAALAAPAFASRASSRAESAAIRRAAVSADASNGERVRVSDVRISTVGPWAAANVAIVSRSGSAVQSEADTFYRTGHGWVDMTAANAPSISMPSAVANDLGIGGSGSSFTSYLAIYLAITWFFGLAAVIDVVLQPARAFAEAGFAKQRWFLITLVGLPLTGVFTWAYYALQVRPRVVAAGGRAPRKYTKMALRGVARVINALGAFARRLEDGGPPMPPSAGPYGTPASSQPVRQTGWRKCICNDGIWQGAPCPKCGGSGFVPM